MISTEKTLQRDEIVFKGFIEDALIISVVAVFLIFPQSGFAQFSLDFIPNDGNYSSNDAYVSCGMSYLSNANSGGGMAGLILIRDGC